MKYLLLVYDVNEKRVNKIHRILKNTLFGSKIQLLKGIYLNQILKNCSMKLKIKLMKKRIVL
ncbi:CRISPR-associated protein Cas2 [Thermosipho africanus H17ap60334]|nr:CRISPR-associated protein Cas2 [Thermosipho africanus H17ap60334]